MRNSWTKQIVHITSYIFRKKKDVATAHGLRAVALIVQILFLEVYLALISLPLYFITRTIQTSKSGQKAYQVRRVITLSTLLVVFSIWSIKFITIAASSILGYDTVFEVSDLQRVDKSIEYISAQIASSPVEQELLPPEILSFDQQSIRQFEIAGIGKPNTYVVIYMERKDNNDEDEPIRMLHGQVDEQGMWEVKQNTRYYKLTTGDYQMKGITYDDISKTQSIPSYETIIAVEKDFWTIFFEQLDVIINIAVTIFVGGAVMLSLFTL